MTIDDDRIKNVFKSYQIIAAVGMSRSMKKSSNWIPVYLSTKNYEIIPVNPNASHIKQWKSYPDLKSIPGKIDILLIFLPSSVAVDIVKNAIERKRNKGDIQVIWLQEGSEERARELAEQEGITFIQGRDIYREYKRLMVNPGD
jgi:predicted CoA-binding protein